MGVVIELRNISVRFGDKVVLDNLNYIFEADTNYCVLGQSGCGKSTLLRVISGLLKPTKGQIFFKTTPITKPNRNIFMMHQTYCNFPWLNCLRNVLMPIEINSRVTEEHIKKAKYILSKVGLEGYENKYPHQLSVGMKQRLAFARILMGKLPVVLMDEPISALDDMTREKIEDLLVEHRSKEKMLTIMVTHHEKTAKKMADKIIRIKKKEVV